MRRLATFAILALLAACGEDDPADLEPADIQGTWLYSASNLTGGLGVTCNISGVTAVVNQTGETFTGTVNGGTASCTAPGQSMDVALESGTITNGMISGNSISFEIDNVDSEHVGTVSGNTMAGTLSLSLDLDEPVDITLSLTGNWTATRQQ